MRGQGQSDPFEGLGQALFHLHRPEAYETQPERFQKRLPFGVSGALFVMHRTIHLYDEAMRGREEVHNEGSDRLLPPEPDT